MFTFYQQLVVQRRGETQPSQLLQLILTSLPRPVRHFQRTCTVFQTILQFLILFLLLQFCTVLKPFWADLEMSGLEDLGPLPDGWSLKWHGVGETRRPWVAVWVVAIVVSRCYCFLSLLRCVLAILFKKPEYSSKENMNYMWSKKDIILPRCPFCFTWNSCFPYYCILVSWTNWQVHKARRTETITTGDNNSNNSNNNSRSPGFSNPMPLQRPALWQRTQVFQSRHFKICSKGFWKYEKLQKQEEY